MEEKSDKLLEKSFKIIPEEFAKLQETKVQLLKFLNILVADKKQLEEKLSGQTRDLEASRQLQATAQPEAKKHLSDLQEKNKELQVTWRSRMDRLIFKRR